MGVARVESPVIHFLTVLMAFFAIMNPIANAPLFLSLTEEFDEPTRRGVAVRAVALGFVIVAVFALLGREIFSAFGITLPAFRIAGGVLIALIGYQMIHGSDSAARTTGARRHTPSPDAALGVAVSPLAIPILAGPGSIATAMGFAAEASVPAILRVLAALAVISLANLAAFRGGDALVRVLGRSGIEVVTRLMGLILAVIGTQMLIVGIRGAVAAA